MFANRLKCPQCGTLYDTIQSETEPVQDKRTVRCQICNSLMAKWRERQAIQVELIQRGDLEDIERVTIEH